MFGIQEDATMELLKQLTIVAQNFDGPAGQHVRASYGYDSSIAIPKSSVKGETKVKQILGFFDNRDFRHH